MASAFGVAAVFDAVALLLIAVLIRGRARNSAPATGGTAAEELDRVRVSDVD